ncbi:cellulose synthase/poly-beta-1,6-N-acetylglucosamine synthase-like glycosyltransferase [Breoghania corrubedonensis]|uniref:Cellulose synthase/poly-beta-1,6-N-acetylglucosamine synthase-like glycosyltransferase n=1 Tax=Breoghania corrubedonensis TaxID=665038 RepID=A0A2T5UYK7_9HYPH|nr:glycosyltransferase family 2 protein [Breoghania corrubedonensis]PTW56570.1 cellulose synthase/poly-beta-1,6-N-acetylglucosamine synthase-like glycosyltransferase [Breoghania corrubedonensis]
MSDLTQALDYITAQSFESLMVLTAVVIIFEIPRYFGLFLLALLTPRPPGRSLESTYKHKVSVILAGHNERDSVRRCIASMREQSRPPDEIVVFSDGSTDGMEKVLRELLEAGEIDRALWSDLRGGKSAGFNICQRMASGDILINIDCDCSLDRDAFRRIVEPFEDPAVGSVAGNIQVRNAGSGLIATMQAIEYMITIALGKQGALAIDQVICSSGGYSAFRKSALESVGGCDAGGGEDLDVTMRLRARGWKIGFRVDSVCYTDVPDTFAGLVRQRFRWERDAVRLRYRKHRFNLNPFDPRFRINEVLHHLEYLIFNILAAAIMPFYLIWLFATYGAFAFVILLGLQVVLVLIDFPVFLLAAWLTPHVKAFRLIPYMFGFSVFNGFVMRFVRLAAYADEWVFQSSFQDSYVPQKVHDIRSN